MFMKRTGQLLKVFNKHHLIVRVAVQSQRSFSQDRHRSRPTDEKLSKAWYWEDRYKQSRHRQDIFDWFVSGDVVREAIEPFMKKLASKNNPIHVVDAGCGNSGFPASLYARYSDVRVCLHLLDYSHEALCIQDEILTKKQRGHPQTQSTFVQCDLTMLPFKSAMVHVVVDKGTIDAVLKDRCLGKQKAHMILNNVLNVLKPGGVYLQISDEDPDSRLGFLDEMIPDKTSRFTFSALEKDGTEYFLYVFVKS